MRSQILKKRKLVISKRNEEKRSAYAYGVCLPVSFLGIPVPLFWIGLSSAILYLKHLNKEMTLFQFITKEYPSISTNESKDKTKELLENLRYLIVINDKSLPIGIVTLYDYVVNPNLNLRDCTFSAISLSHTSKIRKALALMSKHNINALPVLENGVFVGVVKQTAITDFLLHQCLGYKYMFKHFTSSLRRPIANMLGLTSLFEKKLSPIEQKEIVEMGRISCTQTLNILRELEEIQRNEIASPDLNQYK